MRKAVVLTAMMSAGALNCGTAQAASLEVSPVLAVLAPGRRQRRSK
ncbi:MAG: hypothetical protein WDN04_16120 [Rhodospirillales bacterium]